MTCESPGDVFTRVEKLTPHGGGAYEHGWHTKAFLVSDEFKTLNEYREAQRAFLGRYGKQPWAQWDHMLVTEMDAAMHAVSRLVKSENEANKPAA